MLKFSEWKNQRSTTVNFSEVAAVLSICSSVNPYYVSYSAVLQTWFYQGLISWRFVFSDVAHLKTEIYLW